MANRNFNRAQALEKEVKSLFAEVAIGASGAPTITKALGISSISRTGAGDYKITLDDKFVRLMHLSVTELNSSAQDLNFQLKSQAVSSTKEIEFFSLTGGTETDPASGSSLFIKIDLKNSDSGE